MSKKSSFILGSIVLLAMILGLLLFSPDLIFSNGKKGQVTAERPYFPGVDTSSKPRVTKQEIRQVFDYGWDLPLDSCRGTAFLCQIRFEPLPQINVPSKVYVTLRACSDCRMKPESSHALVRKDIIFNVYSGEDDMDFTELEPKWFPPYKKGDIYEGAITIVPRETGKHRVCIFVEGFGEPCFNFGFNEKGELVHLSDTWDFPPIDLPNLPLITDKEVYVKFNGKYITNLFHIYPPLSLKDTSTVDYRVVTKAKYPEGLKLITRDGANISFKMIPGPINKGDTLEGSFKAVPPRVGWNSIGLGVEEPPRQGIKPQNDSFSAQYNLLKDGKLLFIAKGQKAYETFFNYF
jgi:hypothetical protein